MLKGFSLSLLLWMTCIKGLSPIVPLESPLSRSILLSNWLLFISCGISETRWNCTGISMSAALAADWPPGLQGAFDGSLHALLYNLFYSLTSFKN